jgi:hypothetical protein
MNSRQVSARAIRTSSKRPWQQVQRGPDRALRRPGCLTPRSRRGWTPRRGSWASGEGGSSATGLRGSRTGRARVARAVFPPQQVAEVKAIACELPVTHGLPLGRFSRTELHRLVIERGVTEASATTIWRWLHDDALKPWQTRSWISRATRASPRRPVAPAAADLRRALPPDRPAIPVDLHPSRPRPRAGHDRRPRATPSARGLTIRTYGRVY